MWFVSLVPYHLFLLAQLPISIDPHARKTPKIFHTTLREQDHRWTWIQFESLQWFRRQSNDRLELYGHGSAIASFQLTLGDPDCGQRIPSLCKCPCKKATELMEPSKSRRCNGNWPGKSFMRLKRVYVDSTTQHIQHIQHIQHATA